MGSRMFDYFTTKRGRQVVSIIFTTGACGLGCMHILPNSLFLDKNIGFHHMYRSGKEVQLPQSLRERAEKVLAKCELPEPDRKVFKFFTAVGPDVFHCGSTKLKQGAAVGLPINFSFYSVSDINKEELLVGLEHFDFDSPVGNALLGSMILSEEAQKFAIAREIYACTTHYPYTFTALAVGSCVVTYNLSYTLNNKFNLFRFPRWTRLIMYALSGAFGLVLYCMGKDAANFYYEKVADERACGLGRNYILGGIEFYEKLLARNVSLREALGAQGESLFTAFGNQQVFLRTKHMPLSAHLDLVREKLKEVDTKK